MNKEHYLTCDECGSEFLKSSSKMMALCPECAHILYGLSLIHIWQQKKRGCILTHHVKMQRDRRGGFIKNPARLSLVPCFFCCQGLSASRRRQTSNPGSPSNPRSPFPDVPLRSPPLPRRHLLLYICTPRGPTWVENTICVLVFPYSVSYTHLDVYKRQPGNRRSLR